MRAIVGLEVGQSHILGSTYLPSREETHTMQFLEGSAEVYYRLHNSKNGGIATHNAGHPIRKVAQLEHFRFAIWRLSCRVKHRTSRGATTKETFLAFCRSCSA